MLRARSTHGPTRIVALVAALLTLLSVPLGTAPARASSPVNPRFFGLHVPDLTAWQEAGPGAVNLTRNHVYWPQLQTAPGSDAANFNFKPLDDLIDQAEAHHAQPLLVLGLTPTWASSTQPAEPGSVPDPTDWRIYVKAVVARYGTRVDYQVWPEENAGSNWQGTQPQLAELVAIASKIIHTAAPQAVVVSPAMVIRKPPQVKKMTRFFAQKVGGKPIGHYVDAVGLDPYPLMDGTPEDSAALIRLAHRILVAKKVTAPLWNVEINYGVAGSHVPVTPLPMRQQSSYVARNYLLNAANGVKRVYWLAWSNEPELGIQMVQDDGVTPTEAGRALAQVEHWMLGRQVRSCAQDRKSRVWTCTLVQNKRLSWVYWRPSGHAPVHTPRGARRVETLGGAVTGTTAGTRLKVTSTPKW